eukprot:4782899-Amphidinium_carterae.1
MTCFAPNDHFPHIPLKQLRAEDPVYNNLAVTTTFIISDVNCAIMGLDMIMKNSWKTTGTTSTRERKVQSTTTTRSSRRQTESAQDVQTNAH